MAGSVLPLRPAKDGTLRWRLQVGGGPDPMRPGKYLVHSRNVQGSRAHAQRELARLVAQVMDRRTVAGHGDITVTGLIERWLDLTEHETSTADTYRSLLRRYIEPAIGKVRVGQLEPMHIERVLLSMRRNGLSERTRQQTYAVLHASLERAFRWGWIAANPAARVDRPRAGKHEIRLPPIADVVKGVAAIGEFDPLLSRLGGFLLAMGLRRGEVCALRWDDVDVDGRRLHVRHAMDADGRGLKSPKSGQRRTIELDALSVGLLEERWREARRLAIDGGWDVTAHCYVWTRDDTGRRNWRPDVLSKDWSTAAKRVGLDGLRLHDLRHACASLLVAAGVPIPEISRRLGHASKVMTLDVYAHFGSERAVAPAAIERALAGLPTP